jgi:ABC-type dipeptide/oligopeptide/nickel transport system permease component
VRTNKQRGNATAGAAATTTVVAAVAVGAMGTVVTGASAAIAAPAAAAGAGVLCAPPSFFLCFLLFYFIFSSIYMYIHYFNKKKPWVSFDTMWNTVRYWCYPRQVAVYTGMGAVWENPTRSIPVGNLMDMDSV